jgi:hypothetical protein
MSWFVDIYFIFISECIRWVYRVKYALLYAIEWLMMLNTESVVQSSLQYNHGHLLFINP